MVDFFLVFVAIVLSLFTILGDYFLKHAGEGGINWWLFGGGTLVYALGAFGWFYAFKHMQVSTIAGLYGVTTVILLTIMGVFIFHENLSYLEIIGLVFALVSIFLLSRFG